MQSRPPARADHRRHNDPPDQAARMRQLVRDAEYERALHAKPPRRSVIQWLVEELPMILIVLMAIVLLVGLVSLKVKTMERAATQTVGAEG